MKLTILLTKFALVHAIHLCVSFEEVMTAKIIRNARKIDGRCHKILSVCLFADVPWLVEGRPPFYSISELVKQNPRIVSKNFNKLGISPSSEFWMQRKTKFRITWKIFLGFVPCSRCGSSQWYMVTHGVMLYLNSSSIRLL